MKKRMTKVTAGRLVSVVIYCQPSAPDEPAVRAAKQRASSEARAKINRRCSWQKLEALLAANFDSRDLWVTLTYDDAHYPPSRREAVRRLSNFVRALRAARGIQGAELLYVKNTESISESGLPGRLHHHMVINGTGDDFDTILGLWKWGSMVEIKPLLDGGHTYGDYARYMAKEPPPLGKNGWTPSRNLKRPIRESWVVDEAMTVAPPPGAHVIERTEQHNGWGEYVYLKYLLPAAKSE